MMKAFTTHLHYQLIVKMMKTKIKKTTKQQVGSKPLNVFDYLKSLSQKAKDLADEIKDADDGIDIDELLFIGSNREKFNFNIFRTPLSFLSTIYNGETTFKEVEICQRDLQNEINELKFNYEPKNVKEKEKKDGVLM